MKIKFKLPALVLGLMLLFAGTTVKAQDDNVSLQQFYDELSPYGTWIKDPQYGYVWRPDVDQAEFRPYYTNGRWVQTEYGNTWVSNYDWGWAPFHYGRWMYNRSNSWIWLPDTVWGPAWVDWRSGGGYYGWAPMGPSINIHVNLGRRYYRPDYCWNFIPQHQIYYGNFGRYRSYNNVRIINRTRVINNTYVYNSRTYYTGPRPEEVRRATNQQVQVYNVSRNSRADAPRIDRNTVNVYTPRPSRSQSNNPAPSNVGSYGSSRVSPRPSGTAGDRYEGARPDRGTQAPVNNGARYEGARPERGTSSAPAPERTGTVRGENEGRFQGTAPQAPRVQNAPPRQENRGTQARPQETPRQDRQMSAPPQQRQPAPQQRQSAPQQRPQVQQRAPQQAPPSRGTESRGGGREASGRPGRG